MLKRSALYLLAALAVPALAGATCGPTQVCTDVLSSLHGQLSHQVVVVTWSTGSENSSVKLAETASCCVPL